MKRNETEIRRHPNGSIDIDHYIRHCHRQRSLATHRAIDRTFNIPRELIEDFFLQWTARTAARNEPDPAE